MEYNSKFDFYLKFKPIYNKEGYFIDVPNYEEKSIKEVHSPTLRRWVGIANKYIALVSDIETVNYFIEKKREIEIELSDRPDGLL